MKLTRKYIGQYVKEIVHDIITSDEFKPKLKELVKLTVQSTDKVTPYMIIETCNVSEISLSIEYVDPGSHATKTERLEAKDVPEFLGLINKFRPSESYFCSVHFAAQYDHKFGRQRAAEVIVNSLDKNYYSSDQLRSKIIEPLIQWFNDRPELYA